MSAGAKRSNRLQLQQERLLLGEDVLVKEDVWRGKQQGAVELPPLEAQKSKLHLYLSGLVVSACAVWQMLGI